MALNLNQILDLLFSGVLGAVLFKLLSATESFFINKMIQNAYAKAQKWLHKHPVEHAMFLHYDHKHTAKNPRVCTEGHCQVVPYPKSALVRAQKRARLVQQRRQ